MSLKSFHLVFVTVSTLLFSFLAVWSFVFSPENSGIFNALGYVGIAGIVLMLAYGVYFSRKARQIHI
jgi:cytochrome b